MKHDVFERMVENRIKKCRETLNAKSEEYASGIDRLHNFKAAARLQNTSPAQAAYNMATKHLVSVLDMIQDPKRATDEAMDSKITDMVNYLFLIEGCIRDQRDVMMMQKTIHENLMKRMNEEKAKVDNRPKENTKGGSLNES